MGLTSSIFSIFGISTTLIGTFIAVWYKQNRNNNIENNAIAKVNSEPTIFTSRILSIPSSKRESGKIFRAIEYDWDSDEDKKEAPYALFKCVSQQKTANSCEEIDFFYEISFFTGNPMTEFFKCIDIKKGANIPFYYFDDDTLTVDSTPEDLNWSTLKRGKAGKQKWGPYIVMDLSFKNACDGKIVVKDDKHKIIDFWKNSFLIKEEWSENANFTKDLRVYLTIPFTATTKKLWTYWWRPVAVLASDFDPEIVKKESEKNIKKK